MNLNLPISDDLNAQNLIRVALLRERMKKMCAISDFKAQHIHVIGAGVMGGGIATWCAFKGLKVTLQDKEEQLSKCKEKERECDRNCPPQTIRSNTFFWKPNRNYANPIVSVDINTIDIMCQN